MLHSSPIRVPSAPVDLNWFHKQIVSANNEIDGLETSLARTERQLERAEATLAQRDAQIVGLKREQTQAAARYHREIERLTQQSRQLERELADAKDRLRGTEPVRAVRDDLALLMKEVEAEIGLSVAEEKAAALSTSTMKVAIQNVRPTSVPPLRPEKSSKLPIPSLQPSPARSRISTTSRVVSTSHDFLTIPGKTIKKPTTSSKKLTQNRSTPTSGGTGKLINNVPPSKHLENERGVLINRGRQVHSTHTSVKHVTPLDISKQKRSTSLPRPSAYHTIKFAHGQFR